MSRWRAKARKTLRSRITDVVWSRDFVTEDGQFRLGFEMVVVGASMPDQLLEEIQLSLANMKELMRVGLETETVFFTQAKDGTTRLSGLSQPFARLPDDIVTFTVYAGEHFILSLSWGLLRAEANAASSLRRA